jgi:hypothetical protein
MSERDLVLEPGNSVRIHGSIHGDKFQVFVDGNANISLFYKDKFEDVRWIKEQRRREREGT